MFHLPTTNPTLALAGDWHADLPFAQTQIHNATTNNTDTILHVGDFGLFGNWTVGQRFLVGVERACASTGVTVWVTPGNHEDHPWIHALEAATPLFPGVYEVSPHIRVFQRGARFTHGGLTFVSAGGAPSVDRPYRTPQVDWWPEEAISLGDVQRITEPGPVDIVVAHDSPNHATTTVTNICNSNQSGWPQESLNYAAEGRALLDLVVEAVNPRLWVHGHYHAFDVTRRDHTLFVSLSDNHTTDGNMVFLDTTSRTLHTHTGIHPLP